MSYSIIKLQKSRTNRNTAVSSCVRSDSPAHTLAAAGVTAVAGGWLPKGPKGVCSAVEDGARCVGQANIGGRTPCQTKPGVPDSLLLSVQAVTHLSSSSS